jgi:hypothetical protein
MTQVKPLKHYRNSAQRAGAKEQTNELLNGITFVLVTIAVIYGGLVMGIPT